MVYGIGVDIIRVSRIRAAVERWGERFLSRVFTRGEIAYCQRKSNPFPSLAVRFAAKEAMIKALRLQGGVCLAEIEVTNDHSGIPGLKASGQVAAFLRENALCEPQLSLSHEEEYGIAFVIVERKV